MLPGTEEISPTAATQRTSCAMDPVTVKNTNRKR